MQSIFDFGDPLADWDEHVCKHFPVVGELTTPWRWKNAGTEGFGLWLLEARKKLIAGEPIDLRTTLGRLPGFTLMGLKTTTDGLLPPGRQPPIGMARR
jgi:DNA helicase-2/ATP-dependent DNA helicase PcrA